MSNDEDVMLGIAQLGDTAGLWSYDPAGYTPDQTCAFLKRTPPDPDRVVVITAATTANLPNGPLDLIRLTLRFRGIPDNDTDVDELGGTVFNFLHGLTGVQLGGVHAIQILQKASVPAGIDANHRWSRIDTYDIDADVPATATRPL